MSYNLTDGQKDLLRRLVDIVRNEKKGKTFKDASSHDGIALIKPGSGSIKIDDLQDMNRLASEGLIDRDIAGKSYTITQAAFDAVDKDFEIHEESKSTRDTYIVTQNIRDVIGDIVQGVSKADQPQLQQDNSKSGDSFWTKVSAKANVVLAIFAGITLLILLYINLRPVDDSTATVTPTLTSTFTPTLTPTLTPSLTVSPTATHIPTSTPTPTLIRNLSLRGECKPRPPTNIPCIYIMTPDTATPYRIAKDLFGPDIQLVDNYSGVIYELLRDENGYYGGTSLGNLDVRKGWIIVPSVEEAHDFEYFNRYLGYDKCAFGGNYPCLYEVSDQTEENSINNYETIAKYFNILVKCIQEANRTIFTNGNNYPNQVLDIEDGVVLIIPVAKNDCK